MARFERTVSEEAIGSATDIWTAYREGLLGTGPRPFLGYFFLLEDCRQVHVPVNTYEPYSPVDPLFKGASYSKRYELLCRRLVLERLYDLPAEGRTRIAQPGALASSRGSATIEAIAVIVPGGPCHARRADQERLRQVPRPPDQGDPARRPP